MPSYIGSYDGKGDPDNFLHIFEGSIGMQKWLMPVAYHMLTYALKYSARIWWNSQKTGSILNYKDLKAKFRSHFSQQNKFTKTHLAVHNIEQREGESTQAFITRYTNDTLHILGLHEEQRIFGFVHGLRTQSLVEHLSTDLPSTYKGLMEKAYTWGNNIRQKDRGRFSPYNGQNHKLLSNLVKSHREILATKKVAKTFEQPLRLPGANWSKDKTRYCHFHEDYGHEINQCRELKQQIEEEVKSGKLAHLVKGVKGVKEKKEKTTGTSSEERKKEEKKAILDKVYVLMINRKNRNVKKRPANHGEIGEITFPPLLNVSSADPIIIKVYISGRQVNRVYLDRGSLCESWPLGEIPLEITIGEGPIVVRKTLTFVIVKSDSPHNLLLGRTAMQQMGIVVSTVHGAIKFHTPRGIGTIFSEYNSQKPKEEEGGSTNKYQDNEEIILSCIDTEERVVVNDKYPEQKIMIGRQLPTRIKIRLRNLLKKYIDVFAWTSTHITEVPRVLMIGMETFNTELRINVFNHVEPTKQKKRSLAPERNEVIHSQVPLKERRKDTPFHENSEKLYEWKDGSMDERSRRILLKNERILSVITNDSHTNKGRNSNNVPRKLRRNQKSDRIAKWAIELGEHEIEYRGRNSIKGQILVDFLAETLLPENREAKNEEVKRKEPEPENAWKLFTNRASSSGGSGAGLMVVSPEGKEYTYAMRFAFETTNNEAEYEALLAGLRIAKEMEIRELIIFVDSHLVVN
ncbi:reverse transcriptase domain-containing protein [Tanacetum coccineum]